MFDFTLVMSATVAPKGVAGLSEGSINNRERQYLDTLRFYAGHPAVKDILFVDNSGADMTPFKKVVEEIRASGGEHVAEVKFISFKGNVFPKTWNSGGAIKGHGEFKLLDRAVDELLKMYDGSHVMVKVTGRFPILNIGDLLDEFSKRKNLRLAFDVTDHCVYDILYSLHLTKGRWCGHSGKTIVYATTLDFYKRMFYGEYKNIPGKFWGAETLMLDIYHRTKGWAGVYCRFKTEPRLTGFAGGLNHVWLTANNYDGGLAKAKRCIRQFIRTFLPFFKL